MKSRREFQTVRPATEKARRQAVSVEPVVYMIKTAFGMAQHSAIEVHLVLLVE